MTDLQEILKERVKTAALEIFDVEIAELNAEDSTKSLSSEI
jgi:hypothetical protein